MKAAAGDRLKQAREAAGWKTVTAGAEAVKVPTATYVQHENGTRKIGVAAAERYADAFSVSPAWILFGTAAAALGIPTLLGLIENYEQTRAAFNAVPDGDPTEPELLSAFEAATAALKQAIEQEGANATTLAEAKAATRIAAREWDEDLDLCSGLAMAALTYFVGDPFEEAI